ncbi:hypothetical protein FEM01_19785 [Pseudomonas mosselii]|uniref:Uncharacterized protein n=1 Tax=Pseudomonas mosselii TaxID=78327 RepID=A0A5R8YS26_9PSED|nr:hypothetical protein FEM01_19785 [Pseudomonas mosselii]
MADREAHCASSGLCFTRFYGPDSRDPGARPPENLKTVTRGFLAVPTHITWRRPREPGPGSPPSSEMQIRFLGAL